MMGFVQYRCEPERRGVLSLGLDPSSYFPGSGFRPSHLKDGSRASHLEIVQSTKSGQTP